MKRLILTGFEPKWLIIASISFGFVLRFSGIELHSFWYDEGTTIELISPPDGQSFFGHFLEYLQTHSISERFMPLYFVVLHFWAAMVGTGDASLRAFSAVCGALTVLVLTATANRSGGAAHAAWVAALGSASGFLVYYSQEARPYALAVLLSSVLLAVIAVDLRREYRSTWLYLSFAPLSAVAVLTNIFVAVFLMTLGIADLVVRQDLRRWCRLWLPAAALSVTIWVLWWMLFGLDTTASVPRTSSFLQNLLFVPYGIVVGTTFGPSLEALHGIDRWQLLLGHWPSLGLLALVGSVLACAAVITVPRMWVAERPETRFVRLLIIATPLAFLASATLAFAEGLNWLPRHAFFLSPLSILLLPYLSHVPAVDKGLQGARWLARAGLAGLVILNGWSVFGYFFDDGHRKDDFRGVAGFVQGHQLPGERVVLLSGRPILLERYGLRNVIDGRGITGLETGQALYLQSGEAERVMVIINREYYWNEGQPLDAVLGEHYSIADREKFANLSIYRLRLRKGGYILTPSATPVCSGVAMGTKYDQLDIDERYALYRLHEAGKGVREIGRLMGRSVSTISLGRPAPGGAKNHDLR